MGDNKSLDSSIMAVPVSCQSFTIKKERNAQVTDSHTFKIHLVADCNVLMCDEDWRPKRKRKKVMENRRFNSYEERFWKTFCGLKNKELRNGTMLDLREKMKRKERRVPVT